MKTGETGLASTTPAPADSLVSARAVHKHYGVVRAVDGVDLEVRPGELFGLIGHNGAGKTTLFKMMLGLIPLTAGEIQVAGARVGGGDFRAARRRIGYLPENIVLYDNLTGLETLQFFARLKGASLNECAGMLEKVGLGVAGKRRVREYSKGMRQRLGFAQALLGKPRLLFLDEPTNGLDPEAIREFYAILRGLKQEGVTMILTSHILAEIQERVDRLAIMTAGRIRALGTVQALREEMSLPLWIEVRPGSGGLERVRALLAGLAVPHIEERGDELILRCPRAMKMAVLEALTASSVEVLDVHIREPSLEDVFFGFSDLEAMHGN
jgi:Cu-processing system ATP-binding protein